MKISAFPNHNRIYFLFFKTNAKWWIYLVYSTRKERRRKSYINKNSHLSTLFGVNDKIMASFSARYSSYTGLVTQNWATNLPRNRTTITFSFFVLVKSNAKWCIYSVCSTKKELRRMSYIKKNPLHSIFWGQWQNNDILFNSVFILHWSGTQKIEP